MKRLGGKRRKAGLVNLRMRMGVMLFVVLVCTATVVRAQEQVGLEVEAQPEIEEAVNDDVVVVEESSSGSSLSTPEVCSILFEISSGFNGFFEPRIVIYN